MAQEELSDLRLVPAGSQVVGSDGIQFGVVVSGEVGHLNVDRILRITAEIPNGLIASYDEARGQVVLHFPLGGNLQINPDVMEVLVDTYHRVEGDLKKKVGLLLTGLQPGWQQIQSRSISLTRRELEILRLVAECLSNQDIASRLFISESTVKNHITSIFVKTGTHDRKTATIYARNHGLLAADQEGQS